ncbi:Hypothetical predicted protein [Pelobates cultripes]|uniref:Uncharacterized protein n=1 Tax=Pelobates cultripes TaxID=61616 RepID=A0AAD1WQR6_PELCU|nr:Hypothetical predicted protein [Pelobates cultripes]
MADHHRKIVADVALLREDLKLITVRLGAVDGTTNSHTTQIAELQAAVQSLKQQTLLHEQQLASQEDNYRRNNLKITGIADSVPEAELPHLVRRLLTTLVTPKTAKAIALDSQFRIPRPARAPPAATADLIIQFRSDRDKQAILEATRGQLTLTFEGMTLSFFSDLSGGTMAWRRSLGPFTSLLRLHQLRYCWGSRRTLHIDRGSSTHIVHNMQEATGALGLLNLPTTALASAADPVRPTRPLGRNAAAAPEFVPRQPPADPYAAATT